MDSNVGLLKMPDQIMLRSANERMDLLRQALLQAGFTLTVRTSGACRCLTQATYLKAPRSQTGIVSLQVESSEDTVLSHTVAASSAQVYISNAHQVISPNVSSSTTPHYTLVNPPIHQSTSGKAKQETNTNSTPAK